MRTFVAATVAAALIASSASAATGARKPLAPGKPAGVKHAQEAEFTVWYLVGFTVIGAGIGLVASGNGDSNVVSGTTSSQ